MEEEEKGFPGVSEPLCPLQWEGDAFHRSWSSAWTSPKEMKKPAGTFSSPVIGDLRCTWFKSSVNKPASSSEICSCSPRDGSAARPSRASAPGWTRSLCFAFRQPPPSNRKRPPVGLVWGQENGTSHLCVYALSSQGLMTSMREESIPSRAISESRQNRDTRCSRWVPDFCQRWRKSKAVITRSETDLMIFFYFKALIWPISEGGRQYQRPLSQRVITTATARCRHYTVISSAVDSRRTHTQWCTGAFKCENECWIIKRELIRLHFIRGQLIWKETWPASIFLI